MLNSLLTTPLSDLISFYLYRSFKQLYQTGIFTFPQCQISVNGGVFVLNEAENIFQMAN